MNPADAAMLVVAVTLGGPLIVIDAREHRLPNRLTGAAAMLVLLVAAVAAVARSDWSRWPGMLLTGLGMLSAGYLLAVVAGDAVGMGDVKLLGVTGLALGHLEPSSVVLWLLALAATSALWLLAAPLLDRAADRTVAWRKRRIAFGPPIILAWWTVYGVLLTAAALREG